MKGRSCVNIGEASGKPKASGKVKILPMMAHNLWPAVQERLQRSMVSMISKVQFILVPWSIRHVFSLWVSLNTWIFTFVIF